MTTENAGMPDVIYAVPYNEGGHGEWDDMKWTPCPFVLNDREPEDETAYVRKSIVTPEAAKEMPEGSDVDELGRWAFKYRDAIRALLIAHGGE